MGESAKTWRRNDRFRRWAEEPKSEFPPVAYPENARLSVKQVAYLHEFCGKEPRDIVASYPRAITLGQVYLALYHFCESEEAIRGEIERDLHFDRTRSLHDASMTMPSMRAPKPVVPRKNVGM